MTNKTDILCDSVEDLYADGFLAKVYEIQCIVSFAAILPALGLCLAITRANALHRNIRLLLVNFFIATTLSNAGTIIVAGYHVTAVAASKSSDQLCAKIALTGRSCTWLQAMNSFGGFTIATSLIFLAIERIFATVQYKTYENNGGRKIGVVLCVAQWLMSIPALPFLGDVDTRYPYCQDTVIHPRASQAFLSFMLIAQMAGLVAFIALVKVNKRKMSRYTFNSALKLLSVRYQLKENVSTTKLMIPISVASCFLYAISLITVIVLLDDLPKNVPLTTNVAHEITFYARWRELVGFAIPIYTLALCAVLVRYSNHIRQALLKLIGWRRNIKISPVGQTKLGGQNTMLEAKHTKQRYFAALKKQWKGTDFPDHFKLQQDTGNREYAKTFSKY